MLRFVIAVALLMVAPTVHASPILSFESEQGETMDDFVVRIAPYLVHRTHTTGYEVCGVLEDRNDRIKVDIYTSRSPRYCKLRNVSTDSITVHTHPQHMASGFGDGDYETAGYLIKGRRILFQAGLGTERVVSSR